MTWHCKQWRPEDNITMSLKWYERGKKSLESYIQHKYASKQKWNKDVFIKIEVRGVYLQKTCTMENVKEIFTSEGNDS